ncbi:hypothetical protein EYF80_051538 [Liparis tanakae]|uniref:Uncharacterized protein n=1 Tax=Liparis tanakae TaxID=230148 RepID=A0A4Z2FBM9_9TELE|nr:hypothetical protein EYF80_051538 [Liparis tanakae]
MALVAHGSSLQPGGSLGSSPAARPGCLTLNDRNPAPLRLIIRIAADGRGGFTVGQELEQRQVDEALPPRVLLQRDAVASGGEHLPAADGHQLAALVFAGHVVQHGGVVDEGVQFPAKQRGVFTERLTFLSEYTCLCRGRWTHAVLRLLRASSTPFWLYLTMWECISGPDTVSMYCSWIMKAARLAV